MKNPAQIPFLVKEPNIGSKRVNVNTVKTALPKSIFKPKPIGNITINGTKIMRVGIANKQFKNQLDFCVKT